MRIIVPGDSIKECQRRVQRKEKEGWKQISEIKLDTSGYDDPIRWVCVMERPDDPNKPKKTKQWNSRLPIW